MKSSASLDDQIQYDHIFGSARNPSSRTILGMKSDEGGIISLISSRPAKPYIWYMISEFEFWVVSSPNGIFLLGFLITCKFLSSVFFPKFVYIVSDFPKPRFHKQAFHILTYIPSVVT